VHRTGLEAFSGTPAEVISIGDDVVGKPSLEIVKQRSTATDGARWRNSTSQRPYVGSGNHRGLVAVPGLLALPPGSRGTLGEGVDHESHVGTD